MFSTTAKSAIDFLNEYLIEPDEVFRTSAWLLSNFEDSVWHYSLGFKEAKQIDWRVKLPNGELLSDKSHAHLLDGFKYFLILSTRTSGNIYSELNDIKGQQRKLFSYACHIIDLILINVERYQVIDHGLAALTAGNLKEMLIKISSNSVLSEAIYDWSENARKFYMDLLARTDPDIITRTLTTVPALSVINFDQDEENELSLPPDLIISVRAALYANGYYTRHSKFGWAPNSILLSKEIYSHTIWGRSQIKPTHKILCFHPNGLPFHREYGGIRVTTGERGNISKCMYWDYRNTLYRLGILHEINIPAPSIQDLVEANLFDTRTSSLGRHKSLPSELVFECLRNAIEFHLAHGELLIREFCRLAIFFKKSNTQPSRLSDRQFQKLISTKAFDMGIRTLGISMKKIRAPAITKGSKEKYYSNLRLNRGLLELILVYIGATQFVVGLLTARRVSELIGLTADSCLDNTREWLLFLNAKSTSGLGGARNRIARPIEPIGVEMLSNLIRMQKIFKRLGYLSENLKLFSTPHLKGTFEFIDSYQTMFNRNLDIFCDYFETPVQEEKRYYIRQHQLRRFFAMLFFYSKSFGKMDTLRWMLGHNDPSHVWRYITESTDGVVLQNAKAHYVAERLHDGDSTDFTELAQLLKARYGTDDFRLLDSSETEEYILALMEEGYVEIEPEFLNSDDGQTFKVIARIKKQ